MNLSLPANWPLYRTMACITLVMVLLMACRNDAQPTQVSGNTLTRAAELSASPTERAPDPTATATPTPLPSATPLPSPTPTITPTPTATAPPAIVNGNPLAVAVQDAAPQAGAPCGVIDLLDFPLDPPDALNISRGGQDFNVFRNRYDGYHAGEDWWGPGGRGGSFGEPVYSIGHGQVTFAHPFGWGVDQGTVILRHVYPDGTEFYSFYGHLDPPSIELTFGQCVRRGQQIGAIGRPRGSPHLHFEMRYHTPSDPGPGYWSHDPRRSGWLAPSHTIWSWRIAVSPGVRWQRTDLGAGLHAIGNIDDTLLTTLGPNLSAYQFTDGALAWQLSTAADTDLEEELQRPIAATAFDRHHNILYIADRRGRIAALTLTQPAPETEEPSPTEPVLAWDLQLHAVNGTPYLIPLPDGGVALAVQGRLIAFSPAGNLLWRQPFAARPVSWIHWQDGTVISATGEGGTLWRIDDAGLSQWHTGINGKLVVNDADLLLYDLNGIHRIDAVAENTETFFALSPGVANQSDVLALPDGSLLVAHRDGLSRRLIVLDSNGAMLWQRDYGRDFEGTPRLLLSGDQPYLFTEQNNGSWSRVFLHRLDLQSQQLTLVFSGGTRTPLPDATTIHTTGDDEFLITIGGGALLALDARAALEVACAPASPTTC